MKKLKITPKALVNIFQDGNIFFNAGTREPSQINTEMRPNWTIEGCDYDKNEGCFVVELDDHVGGDGDVVFEFLTIEESMEKLKARSYLWGCQQMY